MNLSDRSLSRPPTPVDLRERLRGAIDVNHPSRGVHAQDPVAYAVEDRMHQLGLLLQLLRDALSLPFGMSLRGHVPEDDHATAVFGQGLAIDQNVESFGPQLVPNEHLHAV